MKNILTLSLLLSILITYAQQTHTVSKGETLYSISKKYNVSVDDLIKWNNIQNNSLALDQKIFVSPLTQSATTNTSPTNKTTHKVEKGETLYGISKKYNVSVEQITQWNNLQNAIAIGQELHIADPALQPNPAKAKTENIHTVQAGETLYSIAKDHNLTVEEIIATNKLSSNALSVGQKLIINKAQITPTEKKEVETSNQTIKEQAKRDIKHTVQAGETLFSISRLYGVPVPQIKSMNKLESYELSVGQTLIIQDKKLESNNLKEVEPNFLAQEQGNVKINFSPTIKSDKYAYCLHKKLPVGSIVKITNSDSNESIYARVIGKLPADDTNIIGVNQTVINKIGNGLNAFPGKIEFAKP